MYKFFLYKQNTTYVLRISDCSSDVCSSDLAVYWTNRSISAAARFARRYRRTGTVETVQRKLIHKRRSEFGRRHCANLTLPRKSMSKLFSPMQLGPYELSHRVIMAPLTRMRSKPGDMPGDLMVEYYTQRASKGGLLISEATTVSLRGYGYAGAPGIAAARHVAGWRGVTEAVPRQGGRMFLQLWHGGRQSHTYLQPDGKAPVAPSAIRADGQAYSVNGEVPFSMPRALELREIPAVIEEFRAGAERALEAGFDGVEIHGANGYLPDQFLQAGSNKRNEAYGGTLKKTGKASCRERVCQNG